MYLTPPVLDVLPGSSNTWGLTHFFCKILVYLFLSYSPNLPYCTSPNKTAVLYSGTISLTPEEQNKLSCEINSNSLLTKLVAKSADRLSLFAVNLLCLLAASRGEHRWNENIWFGKSLYRKRKDDNSFSATMSYFHLWSKKINYIILRHDSMNVYR